MLCYIVSVMCMRMYIPLLAVIFVAINIHKHQIHLFGLVLIHRPTESPAKNYFRVKQPY